MAVKVDKFKKGINWNYENNGDPGPVTGDGSPIAGGDLFIQTNDEMFEVC